MLKFIIKETFHSRCYPEKLTWWLFLYGFSAASFCTVSFTNNFCNFDSVQHHNDFGMKLSGCGFRRQLCPVSALLLGSSWGLSTCGPKKCQCKQKRPSLCWEKNLNRPVRKSKIWVAKSTVHMLRNKESTGRFFGQMMPRLVAERWEEKSINIMLQSILYHVSNMVDMSMYGCQYNWIIGVYWWCGCCSK